METHAPIRTRTHHLVIRLNEHERDALARVAGRGQMTISEAIRYLVRRADEEAPPTPTKKPAKKVSR
jgi:hypothetical protein